MVVGLIGMCTGPEFLAEEWTLSVGDVARIFGVRSQSIARWADDGLLPFIRTGGGHRRFRERDVEAFLRTHRAGAEGAGPGE